MKKHILMLNTGGTISSFKTAQGYHPAPGYLEKALASIPALSHPDMPSYTFKEYSPLIDSSNMDITEWNHIAQSIQDRYEDVDGFVIFHGTDTMAYTAAALSFMLENLNKPVILTGSQIPLSEIRNDATDNIITSLWFAGQSKLREVCIYFNHRLFRGNRAKKVSTHRFNAFDSPNENPLAKVGTRINFDMPTSRETSGPFHLQTLSPKRISTFCLLPGAPSHLLEQVLQQPLDALILETYGSGNAPNNDTTSLSALRNAVDRGMVIVNSSQCQEGHVEMNQYATGHALKMAGLISAQDMTREALYGKLLYLFSKYDNIEDIKAQMGCDLRGELSHS